jgi:hypothetical protein
VPWADGKQQTCNVYRLFLARWGAPVVVDRGRARLPRGLGHRVPSGRVGRRLRARPPQARWRHLDRRRRDRGLGWPRVPHGRLPDRPGRASPALGRSRAYRGDVPRVLRDVRRRPIAGPPLRGERHVEAVPQGHRRARQAGRARARSIPHRRQGEQGGRRRARLRSSRAGAQGLRARPQAHALVLPEAARAAHTGPAGTPARRPPVRPAQRARLPPQGGPAGLLGSTPRPPGPAGSSTSGAPVPCDRGSNPCARSPARCRGIAS